MVKRYTPIVVRQSNDYDGNEYHWLGNSDEPGQYLLVPEHDYSTLAERCERLEILVRAIVQGRSHCFIPTDDLSRTTFNWDERANALLAEMEETR